MNANSRRDVWYENAETRLFALDLGDGTPVVFLHGGLADHRAALFHAGSLEDVTRVVVPDLRGAGRSVYAGELSWDLLADDLAALLDHLQVERAVVGGTSMGSGVALRFALRHPHRLRGVVLLSPLYPGADRELAPAADVAMRTMAAYGERALAEGIEALLPLYARLPSPVREAATSMALSFDPASVAATTRFLASGVQPFGSATDLAAIQVPVLVVPGIDAEHPAEVAELYVRHLSQANVATQWPDLPRRLARFCDELP